MQGVGKVGEGGGEGGPSIIEYGRCVEEFPDGKGYVLNHSLPWVIYTSLIPKLFPACIKKQERRMPFLNCSVLT